MDEEIRNRILGKLKELEIDCPECEHMGGDDQYTCGICWCTGGAGSINVLEYLRNTSDLRSFIGIKEKDNG